MTNIDNAALERGVVKLMILNWLLDHLCKGENLCSGQSKRFEVTQMEFLINKVIITMIETANTF